MGATVPRCGLAETALPHRTSVPSALGKRRATPTRMRTPTLASLFSFVIASCLVTSALASEPALSEADSTPWSRRPLAVEAHLGLWAPYGYMGAAVDYSPWDYVGITAGLGKGDSGLLVGAMGRARLPLGRVAPYLELGLSIGPHEHSGCMSIDYESGDGRWEWDAAVWGMAGVGVDARVTDALSLRAYGGAQKVLNESAGTCDPSSGDCGTSPNHYITEAPYVGLAIGYAF